MLKLPVIAVIPAYNSAKTLPALLDELIRQKYDDIFVIDDASTDGTVKVVKSYGPKVSLIENNENIGAGGNRNRIIGNTPAAFWHFIDADMQLLSKNTPDIIRGMKWPEKTSFIGGLVRNPDGSQNPFNYGARPHILRGYLQAPLQFMIWIIGRVYRPAGKFLRQLFSPLLRGLPNIYAPQATSGALDSRI